MKEYADMYYKNYQEMPKDLRKKISLYMLDNIYTHMVKPVVVQALKDGFKECSDIVKEDEQHNPKTIFD